MYETFVQQVGQSAARLRSDARTGGVYARAGEVLACLALGQRITSVPSFPAHLGPIQRFASVGEIDSMAPRFVEAHSGHIHYLALALLAASSLSVPAEDIEFI